MTGQEKMTRNDLFQLIKKRKSYLSVGLDTDINRIPEHLKRYRDPIYQFNKRIIDATRDLCVAYKPNLAFYEAMGPKGMESFAKTVEYIGDSHFIIADAKRGDIGNTSRLYAKAFFETYNVDSVTIAPYMGVDSVSPFLEFEGKWVILLALTSNKGSRDFQFMKENGEQLFEKVLKVSKGWGSAENLMYVVGATHPEMFLTIRKHVPDHFLLVPGIGAQGGDLQAVSRNGMNDKCGLLVNSSRGIIYAGNGKDFAKKAKVATKKLQSEMEVLLEEKFS